MHKISLIFLTIFHLLLSLLIQSLLNQLSYFASNLTCLRFTFIQHLIVLLFIQLYLIEPVHSLALVGNVSLLFLIMAKHSISLNDSVFTAGPNPHEITQHELVTSISLHQVAILIDHLYFFNIIPAKHPK